MGRYPSGSRSNSRDDPAPGVPDPTAHRPRRRTPVGAASADQRDDIRERLTQVTQRRRPGGAPLVGPEVVAESEGGPDHVGRERRFDASGQPAGITSGGDECVPLGLHPIAPALTRRRVRPELAMLGRARSHRRRYGCGRAQTLLRRPRSYGPVFTRVKPGSRAVTAHIGSSDRPARSGRVCPRTAGRAREPGRAPFVGSGSGPALVHGSARAPRSVGLPGGRDDDRTWGPFRGPPEGIRQGFDSSRDRRARRRGNLHYRLGELRPGRRAPQERSSRGEVTPPIDDIRVRSRAAWVQSVFVSPAHSETTRVLNYSADDSFTEFRLGTGTPGRGGSATFI